MSDDGVDDGDDGAAMSAEDVRDTGRDERMTEEVRSSVRARMLGNDGRVVLQCSDHVARWRRAGSAMRIVLRSNLPPAEIQCAAIVFMCDGNARLDRER